MKCMRGKGQKKKKSRKISINRQEICTKKTKKLESTLKNGKGRDLQLMTSKFMMSSSNRDTKRHFTSIPIPKVLRILRRKLMSKNISHQSLTSQKIKREAMDLEAHTIKGMIAICVLSIILSLWLL